jgi:hypothetical protein
MALSRLDKNRMDNKILVKAVVTVLRLKGGSKGLRQTVKGRICLRQSRNQRVLNGSRE